MSVSEYSCGEGRGSGLGRDRNRGRFKEKAWHTLAGIYQVPLPRLVGKSAKMQTILGCSGSSK